MKNKVLYIIGAVLLLLIITNPSVKAFKDYLGAPNFNGLRKSENFFIASKYTNDEGEYIAAIGNFLKIKSYHKKTIKNSTNLNYGVIPIYERYPKQMAKKRIYETLLHNGYTIDNFGTFSVFCKQRFCNDLNTSIVYQLVNRLGTDNYGTKEDFIKNLSDKK